MKFYHLGGWGIMAPLGHPVPLALHVYIPNIRHLLHLSHTKKNDNDIKLKHNLPSFVQDKTKTQSKENPTLISFL